MVSLPNGINYLSALHFYWPDVARVSPRVLVRVGTAVARPDGGLGHRRWGPGIEASPSRPGDFSSGAWSPNVEAEVTIVLAAQEPDWKKPLALGTALGPGRALRSRIPSAVTVTDRSLQPSGFVKHTTASFG